MIRLFLAAIFVTGSLIAGSGEPQTFTGVITDTMCGKRHGMVAGQPDDKCIAACVKQTSSQYALFDGKDVLRLSDQKAPAKFAARRVKVVGVLDAGKRVIRVVSIEAAE